MSLNGLRTALEDDPVFARVRQYALKPHADRSQDLQFGAPSGLRAACWRRWRRGWRRPRQWMAGAGWCWP